MNYCKIYRKKAKVVIMDSSFDFIKKLIDTERYRDYKENYNGGANVIIATPERLNKKDKNNFSLKERIQSNHPNDRIVETEFAPSVIWLIKTLRPYVDYDYLSKYDYYSQIADCIENFLENNEKHLLLEILKKIEDGNWGKKIHTQSIVNSDLNAWYKFGVEHNNPFFIKFMTLWFAFNCMYKKYPGIHTYKDEKSNEIKTRDDVEYEKINEWCNDEINKKKLQLLHNKIFKSPLIEIFKEKPVIDMKKGFETKANKKNFNNLISSNYDNQIHGLFQTMYQIRCNLFHGSKSPDDNRDLELVRCSGEILELCLNAFI